MEKKKKITSFNNQRTYDSTKQKRFKHSSESMTEEDQAFTIREIMEKAARGLLSDQIQRVVQYDENPDFENDDITKNPDFDLSDVSKHKEQIEEKIEQTKNQKPDQQKDQEKTKDEKSKPDSDPGKVANVDEGKNGNEEG